ncbi:hypothetical protein KV102_07905 [Mumia sp. zg.B53]|uniref:hypothetical protein n=1 Tax=Mumia sp. zg.B53 TaxID=2855449 RepID=UPI001C6E1D06|nr:hypothetical protein [Mumia sp. zg.B53]MBW9214767.1 hypothetical protein [Mumia sp. zg.B53]
MQSSRLAAFVSVLSLAALTAGCAATDDPTAPETVYVTKTVTVTPPTEAAPTTPPTEAAAAPTEASSTASETFRMPRLVGTNLQLAQDKLQHLGSYVLDQRDALGLDRFQVLDSNWKVCSQKPKAGRTVAVDAVIVLAAVKLEEACP